jgi:hypothetical protein
MEFLVALLLAAGIAIWEMWRFIYKHKFRLLMSIGAIAVIVFLFHNHSQKVKRRDYVMREVKAQEASPKYINCPRCRYPGLKVIFEQRGGSCPRCAAKAP